MVLWKSLEPPTIFFYMYTSSYFTSKTGSFSNFFPQSDLELSFSRFSEGLKLSFNNSCFSLIFSPVLIPDRFQRNALCLNTDNMNFLSVKKVLCLHI